MSGIQRSILFLALVFTANLIGSHFLWYEKFWWYDVVMHLLGGFFVAMLALHYYQGYFKKDFPQKDMLIVVAVAVIVGVFWEFTEYIGSYGHIAFISKIFQIGDLGNTIKDLAMDTIGGLAFSVAQIRRFKSE